MKPIIQISRDGECTDGVARDAAGVNEHDYDDKGRGTA